MALDSMALLGQEGTPAWPAGDTLSFFRTLAATAVVLGLVLLAAWLFKRGRFGLAGRRAKAAIQVETALPVGDRRSIAIVAVEGRRFLVGLAPAQVSLLAELGATRPEFEAALDRATAPAGDGR